jgi:molybdopterin biosynthesis enzyme
MILQPETPQRIARLTPLDDVLARIDAEVAPVDSRHTDLSCAYGLTLATDVVIPAAIPAAALALRDGWAVRSELTIDAGAYAPAPLPAAVRVEVGDPLPLDADAVAPLDAVGMRAGVAQALVAVAPGEGVLPRGGDAGPDAILPAGRRLGRLQLALLASAGIAGVRVRVPHLRLARARPPGDPMIDAALDCIAEAIRSAGAVGVSPERGQDVEQALHDPEADAVVVVGGTGSGRHDATVRMLASTGALIVHGVGLVPGETSAFGKVGRRPVLALPGRLDAAVAAWHMLGRAMLARLTDSREPSRWRTAKLTHKVASSVGLAELVPVRLAGEAAHPIPIASGYVPLAALALADGWVLVRAESEGYPAGSEVVIRPWP